MSALKHHGWNDEENSYVIRNYGKLTAKQMSQHLGRTEIAVSSHVIEIGLTKCKAKFCMGKTAAKKFMATMQRGKYGKR